MAPQGQLKPTTPVFTEPYGVAATDGKLYVADLWNHRVQVYNNLSGTPTYERTIGTTGSAVNHPDNTGFFQPAGVAVAGGRLYVADHLNSRVQVYNNLSGTPTYENTIGTGSRVSHPDNTGFTGSVGVAVANGRLYVMDFENYRVQVYNNLSGVPTYERTLGRTTGTTFGLLHGATVHGSKLYVTDRGNNRVQIFEWR